MTLPKGAQGYAAGTEVPPERSQIEIVGVLRRNGATSHFFGEDGRGAVVGFTAKNRQVRFSVPYPKGEAGEPRFDAEVRRRWRCLLLTVKAKFESVNVAASISPAEAEQVFMAEFLSNTVLSDGRTVAQVVLPMVADNYERGGPPRLMLPGMPGEEG